MTEEPMHELTAQQAELLVRETAALVELLAQLAKKHPEPFRLAARQMPAWPMMRFLREALHDEFWFVQSCLELGEDYPLDISGNARSHPSGGLWQYLTQWMERLHQYRHGGPWPIEGHGLNAPELKPLLEVAVQMPPLTKATSGDWSKQVLVPLIVLRDAGRDEASCREPVLKPIWRQRGVKSISTFQSRLLSKVRQTLKSLARAD